MPGTNPSLVVRVVADLKQLQRNLVDGSDTINTTTAALTKLAASFSGDKLVQHAHNVVAAIDQVGVSTLTTAEAARSLGVLDRAMEKLELTNRPIPAGMTSTAESLRKIAAEGKTLEAPMRGVQSALSGVANQLAGMFTVGAIIAFGREILRSGDAIQKMADQADLTTDEVQRFLFIAGQSGTSVEALVGAVQNLQQRLGNKDAGAVGALRDLHINAEIFNRLSTYDKMIALASGIQAITDPTKQASLAADLFGKTWKEILPAIKSGMQELGNQAPIMAESTVKSLDRIGDSLTRAHQQATAWGGGIVLAIEQAGFAFEDFFSRFDYRHLGVTNSELLALEGRLNDPNGLQGALYSVKVPMLAVNDAATALSMSLSETASVERLLDERTRVLAEDEKEFARTLLEVQRIEQGVRADSIAGLLGLSKAEQDASQRTLEAWVTGYDTVQKAEKALADFIAKETLSSTDYQIQKIWEVVRDQEAAFRGTLEQRAAFNVATEALAVAHTQKLLALQAVVNQAGIGANFIAFDPYGGSRPTATASPNVTAFVGPASPYAGLSAYSEHYIPGMAHGGTVGAGRSYLVGERGPELFVPSTAGLIAPSGTGSIAVTIASGAVQINYPIMNDPRAKLELAGLLSEALMARLRASGLRSASGA